jgi:hypothetical protein
MLWPKEHSRKLSKKGRKIERRRKKEEKRRLQLKRFVDITF